MDMNLISYETVVKDLEAHPAKRIFWRSGWAWKGAGEGTRDGFESITGTKDVCKYRQELTSTGDVITTVAQNPNAIGYASLASLKDSVKAITVNGVAATEETVKDGTYLVQRPFVLVTKEGEALSNAAQSFFDYATSAGAAELIAKAGAVPAN